MRHHDAVPTIGSGGELISGGGDLALGGVTAYYFDTLYIAILVQITTIISSKFWLIFLVVSPHFPVESGLAFLACRPNTQGFRLGRELSWQVCSCRADSRVCLLATVGQRAAAMGFRAFTRQRRAGDGSAARQAGTSRTAVATAIPTLCLNCFVSEVQQGVDS